MEKKFNFNTVEKRWQKAWDKEKAFEVSEKSKKPKYYVLDMFPYPSGAGLHMGHAFTFTLGDIYARFKRLQGFNVLYPIGYDALGLPAENAAIKDGTHPADYTKKSITNFMKQQKTMGWSYDWSRMVNTSDDKYYKWDQWIFLQMLKKGLAYRKSSGVNWCDRCQTVLANEQVVNGKCWRHDDTDVEVKQLEQWYFKTTNYADEFLEGLDKVDWPQRTKTVQKNWIGKSHGTEINFEVNGEDWPVFTTRPDTIYGVTFLVVSAQHPKLADLVTKEQKKEVDKFLKKVKSVSEKDASDLEKEGAFTGSYAVNPVNGEKVPIYTGNFVVADYGSGMVMAVPAHDKRDYAFAQKYGIEIREVIQPVTGKPQENPEHRKSIVAFVRNPKTKKVISINWGKELGGNLLVGGGLDEGEDPIECAKREIEEETGYCDLKFIEKTGQICHNYFAHSKGKARKIDAIGLHFELKSEKKNKTKLEKDEEGKFKVEWITQADAVTKIEDELHRHVLDRFVNGGAYTGNGTLINSGEFDGLENRKAIDEITKYLVKKKKGKKTTNYKLRDWLISRQRFWGTPIPVVYCDDCGVQPVPEKELPVKLPKDVKFGKGNPLETSKSFMNAKCSKCGKKARRETDTMDTFVNSSWYFLRYTDAGNDKEIFSKKNADYWAPIDQYIGGPEHATMHLLYIRFYTKFLRDIGLLRFDEPALKYFTQGIVMGEDGEKMSKSKGNVVEPLDMIEKYGADTLRLFLVSNGSADSSFSWDPKGMDNMHVLVSNIYEYFSKLKPGKSSPKVESKVNKAVKQITNDVENFKHNLAVIKLRALFSDLKKEEIGMKEAESFLKMLHIYCPFMTEELWSKMKGKSLLSLSDWPKADDKKIDDKFEKMEQGVDKTVSDVLNVLRILKERGSDGEKVFIYVMPFEKEGFDEKELSKRIGKEVKVFATNDKDKHDPEGKAKKAKPGKPGIYVE